MPNFIVILPWSGYPTFRMGCEATVAQSHAQGKTAATAQYGESPLTAKQQIVAS
jgi:hypothetical protein